MKETKIIYGIVRRLYDIGKNCFDSMKNLSRFQFGHRPNSGPRMVLPSYRCFVSVQRGAAFYPNTVYILDLDNALVKEIRSFQLLYSIRKSIKSALKILINVYILFLQQVICVAPSSMESSDTSFIVAARDNDFIVLCRDVFKLFLRQNESTIIFLY